MARPELHRGMADIAATGRKHAATDDERVLYDKAWAAHFTAANHATLALRNGASAAKALRSANIAGVRRNARSRLVQVRLKGQVRVITEAEYYRLEHERYSTAAHSHRRRADERANEGHQHMAAAAALVKKAEAAAGAPPPRAPNPIPAAAAPQEGA